MRIGYVLIVGLLFFSSVLSADIRLEPWSEGVFKQIEKEYDRAASERMRNIYQLILHNVDKPLKEKLELVNDTLNSLPWITDKEKWNADDYWATPFEIITQFGGDCEDMAIGKYLGLRLMGVPKRNLHLGYVIVKATGEAHMVLVWINDERTESLVLDNLVKEVRRGNERTDLLAVYLTDVDGNVILLNDDGKKKTFKVELNPKKLKKLEEIKQRMRAKQEEYKAYNEGRPLLTD